MNFLSTLKRPLLALGAVAGLGLTAACDGSSAPLAVEPGDYEGVGAFIADDFDDEERGFVYLQITVNDDGTVEGTGEVYQPEYYGGESVPDGDDSFDVTGTVTSEGISLDLEGGITADGTVSDGVLSASFGGTTDEGDIEGYLALVPSWGTEVSISCGEFGAGNESSEANGFMAFLVGGEGNLLGAFLGNPDWGDDFTGTATATFDTGSFPCEDTECSGTGDGTMSGSFDGDEFSDADFDAVVWFYEADGDDYNQSYVYYGGFDTDDFEGGFYGSDYEYCLYGELDD